MSYSTPKITIDLEEYNDLLKQKDVIVGDEFLVMAKTVIASLLNNKIDFYRTSDLLKRQGILFYTSMNMSTQGFRSEDIHIEKTNH